jgi:hypothetical protein
MRISEIIIFSENNLKTSDTIRFFLKLFFLKLACAPACVASCCNVAMGHNKHLQVIFYSSSFQPWLYAGQDEQSCNA